MADGIEKWGKEGGSITSCKAWEIVLLSEMGKHKGRGNLGILKKAGFIKELNFGHVKVRCLLDI